MCVHTLVGRTPGRERSHTNARVCTYMCAHTRRRGERAQFTDIDRVSPCVAATTTTAISRDEKVCDVRAREREKRSLRGSQSACAVTGRRRTPTAQARPIPQWRPESLTCFPSNLARPTPLAAPLPPPARPHTPLVERPTNTDARHDIAVADPRITSHSILEGL